MLVLKVKQLIEKYLDACQKRHATFTSLVTLVDGVFAPR